MTQPSLFSTSCNNWITDMLFIEPCVSVIVTTAIGNITTGFILPDRS